MFDFLAPVTWNGGTIHHGDMLKTMRLYDADTFDSCVTDPPYHLTSTVERYGKTTVGNPNDSNSRRAANPSSNDALARLSRGFMGKQWDGGDIAFRPETWAEVYRVLKPGAFLLAFGGTRTAHRMTCAIEDAGFVVRNRIRYETTADDKYGPFMDGLSPEQRSVLLEMLHEASGGSELAWTYGSGFPKSHAVEAMQGWGTDLKPAFEPIIMARKPLIGSVAENVSRYGTGGINIDGCRVYSETEKTARAYTSARLKPGAQQGDGSWLQDGVTFTGQSAEGRFPANLITNGEIDALFPSAPGQHAAEMLSAASPRARNVYGEPSATRRYNDRGATNFAALPGARRDDKGSAARFFYAAKANKADRNGSKHPTVKPINLLQYLARMVTPPGGTILEPFAGSGTMIEAARREGFGVVAIERDVGYFLDCLERVR